MNSYEKKYLIHLFLISFLFPAMAQITPLDETLLECEYLLVFQKDTLHRSRPVNDDMVLRIGKNVSQYFSRHTLYYDSLWAEDFDKASELSIKSFNTGDFTIAAHIRTSHDYTYKNYPEGKITTMGKDLVVGFVYEEDFEPQQWTIIEDSVKQILGYSCQLAQSDFRGRSYYAWFTTAIPYDDGPWKFKGLPGLILEVYDKNKDYHYTISSIRNASLTPVTMYNYDRVAYIKTERHEFLQAHMDRLTGKSWTQINLISDVTWKGKRQIYMEKMNTRVLYDFLERDYR